MESDEIVVAGIGVSRGIFAQITVEAVERLEGVAHVGAGAITSNFISAFSRTAEQGEQAVEIEMQDDAVVITVHLAVFFGYTFTELAAEVRSCVVRAITEQVGCEVAEVNVCVDELVFPKE